MREKQVTIGDVGLIEPDATQPTAPEVVAECWTCGRDVRCHDAFLLCHADRGDDHLHYEPQRLTDDRSCRAAGHDVRPVAVPSQSVAQRHFAHAKAAGVATACTAHHVNLGGGCLNCGFVPDPTPAER